MTMGPTGRLLWHPMGQKPWLATLRGWDHGVFERLTRRESWGLESPEGGHLQHQGLWPEWLLGLGCAAVASTGPPCPSFLHRSK